MVLFGFLTILVAISRIILKRHTVKEVIMGAFIGGYRFFCLSLFRYTEPLIYN